MTTVSDVATIGSSRIGRSLPGVCTYAFLRQRWVKIGRTNNLWQREQVLRRRPHSVICPPDMDVRQQINLAWLAEVDVEQQLHAAYARYRVAGEWFDAAGVLRTLAPWSWPWVDPFGPDEVVL